MKEFIRIDTSERKDLRHEQTNHDLKIFFISPWKVAKSLFYFACTLLAINILGIILFFALGIRNRITELFYYKFDLNTEFNIPTLFSFSILLISAGLLYFISSFSQEKEAKLTWFWSLLSILFVFRALDEVLEVHEALEKVTHKLFGSFRDPWIIFYGVFCVMIAVACLRFLKKLPKRTRILFILAGTVYAFAAMGFELPESYVFYHEKLGKDSVLYRVLYFAEELMEMSGIIIFIYALLEYMSKESLCFSISPSSKT